MGIRECDKDLRGKVRIWKKQFLIRSLAILFNFGTTLAIKLVVQARNGSRGTQGAVIKNMAGAGMKFGFKARHSKLDSRRDIQCKDIRDELHR